MKLTRLVSTLCMLVALGAAALATTGCSDMGSGGGSSGGSTGSSGGY
ncbi:hypothetical protein [Paraburkholderia sp. 2C]|jgi:hypothetical protein